VSCIRDCGKIARRLLSLRRRSVDRAERADQQWGDRRSAGGPGRKSATMGGRDGNQRRSPRSGASRRPAMALPLYAPLPAASPRHRPSTVNAHSCLVPLPRKTPSGGARYWTRRNAASAAACRRRATRSAEGRPLPWAGRDLAERTGSYGELPMCLDSRGDGRRPTYTARPRHGPANRSPS
jgi:hypothetical protein